MTKDKAFTVRALAIAMTLAASTLPAQSAPPPDSVSAAVQSGLKLKRASMASGYSGIWGTRGKGFSVTITGPLMRANNAAAEAAKKYRPYSTDSIPAAWLSDDAVVTAHPFVPNLSDGRMQITSPASHIVVRSRMKGEKDATPIQPDSVRVYPVEWSNAVGGKFESKGIMGFFPRKALPENFDVLVVTDEREYTIEFRKGYYPVIR